MKLRPPATPILNLDPYFSVWLEASPLSNTIHWTGKPNTMCGRVWIDRKEYHFFGQKTALEKEIPDLTVENMDVNAFSTVITYANEHIRLSVRFTSPTLVEDLYLASRPVAYCHVSVQSIDGQVHDISVRFTMTEEFVLNTRGEGRALAHAVTIPDITAIKMGNGKQNVLWRSGDDIRIDWGYLYLGVVGEGRVCHTVFDDMYAICVEADVQQNALFLFAYDDVESIQYFGENLKAYWKKDGKTIEQAIAEAAQEYDTLLTRCNAFSDRLKADAIAKGNAEYAELLLLSVRQIMAAHKLVIDTDKTPLYISKECFSNGCAATVDITYPSAPIFLRYNPELLKGALRPVMRYAATEEWCFGFAPHDVGQYPLLNGQMYGVKRQNPEHVELYEDSQMPVEECGNMLILFAAICEAEQNATFALPYLETIDRWCGYLLQYGLDPAHQLCTDDFAGHLSHNVNLSIKAIMGIAGYSRILSRLGKHEEADHLMKKAREYAASVITRAVNSDGSYRLSYDKPETFSLKYNAVWDKLWGTELFPEKFYRGEMTRYKKELLPYGVPLDSREAYTKSDWLVWVASLAENQTDFDQLIHTLWLSYHTMRTRVPMTDWYYCDTSHMVSFRHRSVLGGLFIKLLF